jgi:dihydrofolate synthase/folylpolyglutamate synthase
MLPSGAPLSDWLAWLETLSPKEINLGLERVQQVLGRLKLNEPDHVLLIAGTNGKGSSAGMADALLRAAGLRTGAYTSPHVSRYNERILVNGDVASDEQIIAAFETVEAVRGSTELTYFEFGTLAAAVVFATANLDVWILEVGLGGRLDATNAFNPTASLITNISLDHCDWLGHDVETIAVEKAGVMRARRPTVYGGTSPPESILRAALTKNATLLVAGRDFDASIAVDTSWTWNGPSTRLERLRATGLLGEFQTRNASAVLALLDVAGFSDVLDSDLVNRALPNVSLPGRSQLKIIDGNEWLIDVAHNPAAAQMLATTLATMDSGGATLAIVGLLDDKDVDGVVSPLAEHVDQWIAVAAVSHRAMSANELARQISNLTGESCLVATSIPAAIEFARLRSSENDRILVTGSFFTVGPVLDQLAL